MIVGIPKEIKDGEARVAATPDSVRALVADGHSVRIEPNAGAASGFGDAAYVEAGALISPRDAVWQADLVTKVKELYPAEYGYARPGLITFCFQHFAPNPALLQAMLDAQVSAFAFETVGADDGSLPILKPMSEIAGRLALPVAMWALQNAQGGRGTLLAGTRGVAPGRVVIIGAGASGAAAAETALRLGCHTTVFARSHARLKHLEEAHGQGIFGHLTTAIYSAEALNALLPQTDVLIGAVLVPGEVSPKLISRAMMRRLPPGAVYIDIGIDQTGIAETARPTSHSSPFYVEEGVTHYCVPNMPAAAARTATQALVNAALPYLRRIAAHGVAAVKRDAQLASALQTFGGHVTCAKLARDMKLTHRAYPNV
jgi:alanine dehydrogenase